MYSVLIWNVVGLAIYLLWARRRSLLEPAPTGESAEAASATQIVSAVVFRMLHGFVRPRADQ